MLTSAFNDPFCPHRQRLSRRTPVSSDRNRTLPVSQHLQAVQSPRYYPAGVEPVENVLGPRKPSERQFRNVHHHPNLNEAHGAQPGFTSTAAARGAGDFTDVVVVDGNVESRLRVRDQSNPPLVDIDRLLAASGQLQAELLQGTPPRFAGGAY